MKRFNLRMTQMPCILGSCALVLAGACATASSGNQMPDREGRERSVIAWHVDSANAEIAADLRSSDSTARVWPMGALSLSARRTVVLDGGRSRLLYYDERGSLVRTVDLAALSRSRLYPEQIVRINADTIAVLGRGQAIVVDESGKILSSFNAADISASIPERIRVVLAVLQDRKIVFGAIRLPQRPPREGMTRWVDSLNVYVVDSSMTRVQLLGRLPAVTLALKAGTQHQVWFAAHGVFGAHGDKFYYGFGSEYQINVYSSKGELIQTVTRPWEKIFVTAADIDAYIEGWGKRWIQAKGAAADSARKEMHADPFYPYVPAFSQFMISPLGELWVRSPNLIDAQSNGELNTVPLVPSRWSIFDRSGRWIGSATLPAWSLPQDVNGDTVLAIGYGPNAGKILRYNFHRPGLN